METRPSLRQRFFGTWDRKYNLLNIVFSILGPIISLFILYNPEKVPAFIIIRDVIIFLILIGASLFLFVKYVDIDNLQKEQERTLQDKINKEEEKESAVQKVLSVQLDYANRMVSLATQELFGRYKSIFLSKLEIPTDPDEYEVFKAICTYTTAKVRDAIKEYLQSLHIELKDDISVSVKLILHPKNILDLYPERFGGSRQRLQHERNLNQEQLWVITAYRDPETFYKYSRTGKREVLTTLYSIEKNTAFRHIFSGQNESFRANDLADLFRRGLYQNENAQWQSQYNSTLVVPIVLEHAANEKRRYLGFLTVDSLNKEGHQLYERDECYWILNHAALVLSNYFIAQILYHDVQSIKPVGGDDVKRI